MAGRVKNFLTRLFKKPKRPKRTVKPKKKDKSTRGERAADLFTTLVGSWPFIICQTIILGSWIAANAYLLFYQWDPYPFILLNLFLSFQAAYTGPIIMMSQNRQTQIDRETMRKDYELSEDSLEHLEVIVEIMKKYERDRKIQFKLLKEILEEIEDDDEHTP